MSKISDEDKKLFREAVKGCRPLAKNKHHFKKIPKKPQKCLEIEEFTEPEVYLSDFIDKKVNAEDKLFFTRPGIPPKKLRELRQGKLICEAILDLHGRTIEETRQILQIFLKNCQTRNLRVVRIIHGKSQRNSEYPILKNQINHWLPQFPSVLAFASCIPRDGGTGAIYVLLK